MRRREFITLLGGAAACGRLRRGRSSLSGCGGSACSQTHRRIQEHARARARESRASREMFSVSQLRRATHSLDMSR